MKTPIAVLLLSGLLSAAAVAQLATRPGAAPAASAAKPSEPPMRIEVKVYPNKNDRPTNAYYDERSVRVGFRVDVRNGEGKRKFAGGKATMIAFAKDLRDPDQSKIISREEFPVTLEPLTSMTHDTKDTKLTYDNIAYKYGFKYSGYLLVLKDQTGNNVAIVGSSATVEKFADAAMKLGVNDLFDKSFKKLD